MKGLGNGLAVAALLALTVLSGCDDNDKKAQPAISAEKSATPSGGAAAQSSLSDTRRAAEAERDKGKPLQVVDISEVQLDGASTLVVTFSVALDDKQNFAQKLHLVDSKSGAIDGGWELAANQRELRFRHLEPNRKLIASIDSGLKALNGATLESAAEQEITTRDVQPMVGFASRGSLLPTRVIQGLPILALNVNSVDVDFFRVKPASLPTFLSAWEYGNSLQIWQSDELLKKADLVYSGRFDLNPARNTREKMLLPLSNIDAFKQPGVYLAVMKKAGSYSYSNAATLFTRSDIGLSLHQFPTQMDVFSQSLENGAALSGITLTLLDEKGQTLQQATSDKQGHAQLKSSDKAKLLLATQDQQTTLLDLSRPALDLAEFAIAGPEGYDKQLFIFGPRDLYRPGETVIVNALLRDADGKPLPPQPVKLEVVKPDGEVARTQVWQPENGLYQYRYSLPESAATGGWTLRVNTGDNRPRSWRFNVEDFLPERMALSLKGADHPLSPAEDLSFQVNGRYLYGAPAAGNHLQGQLYLRPNREAVAALPGYQFGDINEDGLKRSLDELDITLDAQGDAVVSVPSGWEDVHSPINVIMQASLLESGGRPVTRRITQAIWPADALPGIRPLFGNKDVYDYRSDSYRSQPMVEEGSNAAFDILLANASGEKLAAQNVDVRLVRERRDYYWSFSDGEGWQSRYDQKDLVEEQQQISLAADGTARVEFPVDWGSYRLEVRTADNNMLSSVRFWAGYSWQDNTAGSGALRPDQVKLKLDKPAYRPGEKASVHIEAPAAGKGYLMLESSNGPLWWQEIDVPAGGLDVEVPVNQEWRRHDLYLSALVIRPGEKEKGTTPKRAVGLLHLPLADNNRKLTLALDVPEKIRPNQTLTVKVKAARQGGEVPKNIHLLLSAVDSGVLSITDYKTPDPFNGFFGRKRYNADQYDIYGQLIEGQGRQATLRFGGDGDEDDPLARGGQKPVTHVNIVAQQALPVTLNANGEGSVELPVPEFNGELRLMAQVWSDDSFGQGEQKLVVAAPLISELATPRFMAGGDSARLALDLTNLSGLPQTLKINLAAQGLVKLDDSGMQTVALKAGERTTLLVPVSALTGFGDGEITAEITGLNLPGETVKPLHQRWKVGVRPAWPAETRNFEAVVRSDAPWSVPAEALSGLAHATLQGQLAIGSRPPLNIARYIRELYAYPYDCLEQTVSGLYPSLYTNHAQLMALGIKGSSDTARRESIDVGIDRLAGMQRLNGGFGLWGKESQEEFWLTAYVTDFLIRASEQGYSVSQSVLDRANQRLLRYLQDANQIEVYYSSDAAASRFSVQAYAALVLARQQKAPLGALRTLYNKKASAKAGLPLVQLGIALRLMGDVPRGSDAINQGMDTSRTDNRLWLGDYGSALRDNAMILNLLAENKLLLNEQDLLLVRLSQQLNGKRWLSTQENNALFLAGKALMSSAGQPWQAVLNDQTPALSGTETYTGVLSATQLTGGVSLANPGSGNLYGRLDVVGYPQNAPEPWSNNLQISRSYLGLDGREKSLANLKSGELVLVQLKVSARERVPDALVVDLLPAGLELENQNLSDSSASLADSAADVQESIGDMQQASIKHLEFRDDRFVAAVDIDGYRPVTLLYLARAVTPGSYQVPAPQVESMYVPQWRALGVTPGRLNVH
ncbi:alpha-2-macroglobulin family protein [Erwiniaceae bacterium BAC15a-03b]|uniref:Alpha-2-macroglobulin n=1 Tax=Winslowiella arboricola TaxID=2978220 RepID=A0A9J6PIX5_9GAMM|nr:alpha-2-macroglobulin [Winslowiella arboricola]MCU5773959.1 alpha-2-macroglobulin family protein [Winslowiella arboricola]MCU5777314.1 alpha-2-macroglobulin family protein [Winslowiella arboricola]